MRLVGTALECYKYLEPLYNDYRKMKKKDKATGSMIFFAKIRCEIWVTGVLFWDKRCLCIIDGYLMNSSLSILEH